MAVLLYRTLGLGDFLTAVPAYRAVARASGRERVLLAAPSRWRPLTALVGGIDEHLPTPELAPPYGAGYVSLAVNLHGRGPRSDEVLQSVHPDQLVAFGCPDASVPGPPWVDDEHDVVRWVRLLRESGIPADPSDLRLAPPRAPSPRPGAVVVHPGASTVERRWPVDRFAAVAAALKAEGRDVVVTGVPEEQGIAEAVARGAGLDADAVLAGALDIGAMAALVASARLVLCGDTGVAHLASAFGTRSVVMFGRMSPRLWGPPPWGPHTVLDAAGPVEGIGVDEVLAAVRDRLERP